MGPGTPFPDDINANSLRSPTLLESFAPQPVSYPIPTSKQGCETWSTAWSPDGRFLAWSCGNCIVKIIPASSYGETTSQHTELRSTNLDKVTTIDAGDRIWSVAIGNCSNTEPSKSPNLNWFRYKHCKDLVLAVGLNNGRIKVYNCFTGDRYLELVDHKDVVRDLKFAPNASQTLVSASRDGTLKVWELDDDGNMMKTLKSPSKWLYACAWSPDAAMLASVGDNRSVILWDMKQYKVRRKLQGHHHDVCSCDFSPDGALLATSSCDTRVIIWDPHTGVQVKQLLHMFPAPSMIFAGGANDAFVRGVSWSRDGVHVATVSDDSYVRFWDLTSASEAPCQAVVLANALCCTYSPDGSVLAVGTRNGTVALWLAPMKVRSLQHACRMAIRRVTAKHHIQELILPKKLKNYIQDTQTF